MIEKMAMRLTFFLCKYLFKKHGRELLMITGTGKDVGRELIYSDIPSVSEKLMEWIIPKTNVSEGE